MNTTELNNLKHEIISLDKVDISEDEDEIK